MMFRAGRYFIIVAFLIDLFNRVFLIIGAFPIFLTVVRIISIRIPNAQKLAQYARPNISAIIENVINADADTTEPVARHFKSDGANCVFTGLNI